MRDTGFSVPEAKLDRLATFYRADPAIGALAVFDEARGGRFARPPALESGAGGLVSTVDDLLAFGRMMLNKGKLGNERILSRLSVELMTTDHITPEQKAASPFFPNFWDNRGWGFGVSIITRRDEVAGVPGRVRLGRRLRHVLVRGPQGGDDRDPDDAAPLGPRVPGDAPGFLDVRLPDDRRLKRRRMRLFVMAGLVPAIHAV
jgi:CubicO group peptidase (beta-lactamase class C family)